MLKKLFKLKNNKSADYTGIVTNYNIHETSNINFGEKTLIDNAVIEDYVNLSFFQGHASNITIGRCTYAGPIQLYGYNGDLDIGRYCSIAGRLVLICGNGFHRPDRISNYPFPFKDPFSDLGLDNSMYEDISKFPKSKLVIGNDVWIGEDVVITKNVKVGNGVVIGSKSVVTNDIPSYAIVGGNPATVRKFRHDEEEIRMLEKIKWWEWRLSAIIDEIEIFSLTGEALKKKLLVLLDQI